MYNNVNLHKIITNEKIKYIKKMKFFKCKCKHTSHIFKNSYDYYKSRSIINNVILLLKIEFTLTLRNLTTCIHTL